MKTVKVKSVVLSLVLLVLGFLLTFSYRIQREEAESITMTTEEWNRNVQLRNDLNELEARNLELQNEVFEKQDKLLSIEQNLAENEARLTSYAHEAGTLRMFLGNIQVQGEGVIVTLDDGDYNPADGGDVNRFLVHEHHVFNVINELYASGAEAVAINGQRLKETSYIVCDGPVITVDGKQFPAPFLISAIGKADVLEKALNLQGGVRDQLVNDNIVFKIEKKSMVVMDPILAN